jgi:hypothetical protein
MKLDYYLKEGLVDIRRYPVEWGQEGKKARVQIRLNGTPGVRIIDTNMGKALLSDYTGEMLLIDHAVLDRYAADAELLLNIDIHHALQALKD